ncbi:uncharacterized protein LOC126994833 [Eriocheir sinensis]|uniref:uncharacterized protein LOC126994833 n=1 Tax=Eriocheir sinensis TaxID=95602 RepID=UPI0021C95DF2|nr:uncharacterized protein LOC126994833 [Eriocheir sinensis]
MCSGPHMTEACLAKYKAGESVTALCPNCRRHHHAWSRRCPSRLTIVDRGIQRQECRAAHNPSRPAWTGRSRSRSQRQPAPPGQTTLASQEHFPALPPPGASRGNGAPAVPPPATPPPPPATETNPASTSTPAPPPRPASASVPSAQREQRTPALPPPALPQRVRRRRNRGPRPPLSASAAPLVPPPGRVLVTRAVLEGMLASFALALAGLLQFTPDEAALQVIAKAKVEECFPTVDSLAASPATPLQTPVAALPTAQTRAREDGPPPAGEAQPAPATQTAKPRSHIPVRAAPTRPRIPQPKRMVTPKRRGPAPSRATASVTTPGPSSATGH